MCQSFRTFFIFDNIVLIFDTFRNFTSIRNTIGSGLKRVATGSVSKYPTSLFAQLSKTLLENVNFNLKCPLFNIQKPPSKITRFGVHQQQQNSVSDRLIFEKTSVDSC